MSTETNQDAATSVESGGEAESKVQLSKSEYEELVNFKTTAGSLKRELKDAKKALEEAAQKKGTPETPHTDSEEFGLLHKTYLRSAGITESDEIELVRSLKKKTGLDWDELLKDDFVLSRLENLRTTKANAEATTGIQGSPQSGQAKNTPEYWVAKGTPPTREQVPDRKARYKINKALIAGAKNNGKQFYND